jgi:dTDP-4-amino-4,6-dideoxygalactose transaminase
MLVINHTQFNERAEIIREMGTNRSKFFRGEVDKYGWVDIGSSFLPSDIIAAFLYAQLEKLEVIQLKRKEIWQYYFEKLKPMAEKGFLRLPFIPEYATNNAHMFYIVCNSLNERTILINQLKSNGILAASHYISLHHSPFYRGIEVEREMPFSDLYTERILRLPFYYDLLKSDQDKIVNQLLSSILCLKGAEH